jgi:exopolysaccharide biosynthesis polyprenyl glycosylphosphotransferase
MPLAHIPSDSHWKRVTRSFLIDASLLPIAFKIAATLRFEELFHRKEIGYAPSIIIGAISLPALLYIFGFYASTMKRRDRIREALHLVGIVSLVSLVVMVVGAVDFSARVGRGVLGIGMLLTTVLVLTRHLLVSRHVREQRTAFVVGNARDEALAHTFNRTLKSGTALVGVFTVPGYDAGGCIKRLGCTSEIDILVESLGIECVMCDERLVNIPAIGSKLRKLRFQGVNVSTLTQAFEEQYQIVPIELVTEQWLLSASSQPQMIYIRKLKRAFDLVVASALLLLFAPLCLIVVLLIKFSSPGPLIYRQTRTGKFGRPFQVLKFRSMRVDAEGDGRARWWTANDSRETWLGRWLRKFRVDEIPQLINILVGDMSFVGPRPERPEFAKVLAEQVPFFEERTMVLPGLTGWAQVNYPYGSNAEDAARKIEFDLYYMKHMSLVLDLFILLDTMRTVLRGGALCRDTGRDALHGLGSLTVILARESFIAEVD